MSIPIADGDWRTECLGSGRTSGFDIPHMYFHLMQYLLDYLELDTSWLADLGCSTVCIELVKLDFQLGMLQS